MAGHGQVAYVALGSNLGPSRETVLRAMDRLQELSDEPLLRSSLYETEPVDCPSGSPKFVNAVVGIALRSGDTPETLLRALQAMEREFGRQAKRAQNEARS